MKLKSISRLSTIVATSLLFSCTYTVYLPDDEAGSATNNERAASANSEFGNQCRYGSNGEYGICPTSNGEMVGTSCSCPTPSGQIMGTVSKY
ncbi:hypothetical protein D1814_12170 [Alteromonas sp. BL110]|uniref:hypothetical protein n=1 Tax=Alteromonas sp. BL110 TaxID=1714845 RepID=UPI000E5375CD|nr:hypothetical protein [Alteromonas sp. BL110]AXT39377.1 hypothetical protein D1814_12170 [Alteromonas sp. BL110]RKM82137.1 hypothetical protein D7031_07380 [Alteromonas sp. BL110]